MNLLNRRSLVASIIAFPFGAKALLASNLSVAKGDRNSAHWSPAGCGVPTSCSPPPVELRSAAQIYADEMQARIDSWVVEFNTPRTKWNSYTRYANQREFEGIKAHFGESARPITLGDLEGIEINGYALLPILA